MGMKAKRNRAIKRAAHFVQKAAYWLYRAKKANKALFLEYVR